MVGPTSEAPQATTPYRDLVGASVGWGSWMMDGTPFFSLRGGRGCGKTLDIQWVKIQWIWMMILLFHDALDEWRDEIRGRSFMIGLQSRIPTKTHVYEPINATMCFIGVETAHRMVFLMLPASQWGYLNSGLHIGRLWSMRSLTGFMADAPKPSPKMEIPCGVLSGLGPCQMVEILTFGMKASKASLWFLEQWRNPRPKYAHSLA